MAIDEQTMKIAEEISKAWDDFLAACHKLDHNTARVVMLSRTTGGLLPLEDALVSIVAEISKPQPRPNAPVVDKMQ